MSAWVKPHPEGAVIRILTQPKASRSELIGLHGEGAEIRLKVRVAAPPVDGEANEEILRFLKKCFKPYGVREVRFLRGETSKQKDLLCVGIQPDQILQAITEIQQDSVLRKRP